MDLYLGVKVRKNDEIQNYDQETLDREREELKMEDCDSKTLIQYIQSSFEIILNMKNE